MLSVKAREAADTIFQVFGMTQLRIKPNLRSMVDWVWFSNPTCEAWYTGFDSQFESSHTKTQKMVSAASFA